jgi:hypothetical protein
MSDRQTHELIGMTAGIIIMVVLALAAALSLIWLVKAVLC